MEEDVRSSCGEYTIRLKRELCDLFGPFDEFYKKINNGGLKHGLVRSKLRGKASPLTTFSNASPSQIPVQTLLNSMKNLAEEEPISNLTSLPLPYSKKDKIYQHSCTPSSSSSVINDYGNDRDDYKKRKRKERSDENMDNNGGINGNSNNEQNTNYESDRRKRNKYENGELSRSATPKSMEYDRGGGNDTKLLKESLNRQQHNFNRRNNDNSTARNEKDNESMAISPDSGVHSTENDMGEQSVDDMLHIMTSLNGYQLSPISDSFIAEIQRKQRKNGKIKEEEGDGSEKKKRKKFKEVFDDAESSSCSVSPASSSAASSPRSSTPPPVLIKEEPTPVINVVPAPSYSTPKSSGLNGEIRLNGLKYEKIQKLIGIAKTNGCLLEEKENSDKNVAIENDKRKEEKPTNRKIQQLSASEPINSLSLLKPTTSCASTPAAMSIGGTSSKNTPIASRPGSSMSSVPKSQNATPKQERPGSSASTTKTVTPPSGSSSSSISSSWKCAWSHARLTTAQRVQIPDPTVPNPKSKMDFYHGLAKKFKSSADNNKDRVSRVLDYMVSSVYFIMESIARNDKENTQTSKMQCLNMYKETQDLLRVALFQFIRDTDDLIVMHLMPRIKMIGQIMLAIMHYQMFQFRAEQVNKYAVRLDSKELDATVQKVQGATTGDILKTNGTTPWMSSMLTQNTNLVQVPQAIFDMYRQQTKNMHMLLFANNYWNDWKMLELKVDLEFIKNLETVCKNQVTMEMSFEALAPIVLTAVSSLLAEYNEEKSSATKPPISKAKRQLEAALQTGGFHPPQSSRQPQKTSQQKPPQKSQ